MKDKYNRNLSRVLILDKNPKYCWARLESVANAHCGRNRVDAEEADSLKDQARWTSSCHKDAEQNGRCWCGKFRKQHELKTWPLYFEEVESRKKNFEVRRNDRGFNVGDTLILKEFDPDNGYTGRTCERTVTYILDDPQFVIEGHVILSID